MGRYSFSSGSTFRIDDYVDGVRVVILLGVLATIIPAFLAVMPSSVMTSMVSSLVPSLILMLNLALTVTGIFAMFAIPDKGALYTLGWTFVSILLLMFGLIGGGEFLIDLIPVGILVIYILSESGVLSFSWSSGGYLDC